jgi:hypothetical protein
MNLQPNSGLDQEIKGNEATLTPHEVVANIIRAMPKAEFEALFRDALAASPALRLMHDKYDKSGSSDYDGLCRLVKCGLVNHHLSQLAPGPVRPLQAEVVSAQPVGAVSTSAGPVLVRRWPRTKWGIPSLFLRCCLFAAIAKTRGRTADESVVLAAQAGGITIRRVTGAEWTQYDLSVLMLLVQIADENGYFAFGVDDMLHMLGIAPNGGSRRALEQSLDRLCGHMRLETADAESKNRRKVALLPDFTWSTRPSCGTGKKCWGRIADALIELYLTANITHIDSAQRLALPAGLAQWLHAYYSSHRDPIPVQAADLAKWAGLTSASNEVNRLIRDALAALQSVGFLSSFHVSRTGLVTVERSSATT